MIEFDEYQKDAVIKMKNGCILCGGVGSGKSRTALLYYFIRNGGDFDFDQVESLPMYDPPKDLFIITTARKRDDKEWDNELIPFLLSTEEELNLYSNKVVIDSWNNIKKYKDVKRSFFIFDEQRVVGHGSWVKSFLKIAENNEWILLSATPGDTWSDYIPVFIANGFYKNRSEFLKEHAIFSPFTNYPKIQGYVGVGKLLKYRKQILIDMDYKKPTVSHHEIITVPYKALEYRKLMKERFDEETNAPFANAASLCFALRKLVNSDESRQLRILELCETAGKVIIFYNFNYERDILRSLDYGQDFVVAEWNGEKHEPVPNGPKWVYLVQYTAGCEGWNCTKTDTMVFYSQNYSYKVIQQAAGRIDRRNTPYKHLYYYHLKSTAPIDLAIARALREKKQFNEKDFLKGK